MERFGITRFLTNVTEKDSAKRALTDHPDKFWGILNVDPNTGMEALARSMPPWRRGASQLKAVHVWGTALVPQVPLDDKKMYPVYAKCVEAGLPIVVYAGVPGPRLPMGAQLPMQLDEVCWFFPELKIVTRHGAEPWTELMVKLLLKWPNLYYSTSAFAPKHYPQDIIDFANTRGADKIIFAGYWAAGLPSTASTPSSRTCRSATTSGPSSCARTPTASSARPAPADVGPRRCCPGSGPQPSETTAWAAAATPTSIQNQRRRRADGWMRCW